jgi:uncharacterized DUF497 family protein
MRFDFDWDARKAVQNQAKHGVTFLEASTVFLDPLARIVPDGRHSALEVRLILFGHSSAGRLLAVMFTERAPSKVRIISARPATRRERHEYEEESH